MSVSRRARRMDADLLGEVQAWLERRLRSAITALEADARFPLATVMLDHQCPDLANHAELALLVIKGRLRAEVVVAGPRARDARDRAYWHPGALAWVRLSASIRLTPRRPPRWVDGQRGIVERAPHDENWDLSAAESAFFNRQT